MDAIDRAVLLRNQRQRAYIYRNIGVYINVKSSKDFYRKKKYAKYLYRKFLNKNTSHPALPKKFLMKRNMVESNLLSAFLPDRKKKWLPLSKRFGKYRHKDLTLNGFSLLDNFHKSVNYLEMLVDIESRYVVSTLNFLDTCCLDISPYLLLAAMRKDMGIIFLGGRISSTISGMITAVGLSEHLYIRRISGNKFAYFSPFPLQSGDSAKNKDDNRGMHPSRYEKITDNLVRTIKKWIRETNNSDNIDDFIDNIKESVPHVIGETLDNAERHGDGTWLIAGFMAPTLVDKSDLLELWCSIAMYSPGKTISESISGAEDQETIEAMANYVNLHKNSVFSEETMKMIYALQEGVSRVSQKNAEDPLGGRGLMEIIQFAGNLGKIYRDDPATLGIWSGETFLKFSTEEFDKLELSQKTDNCAARRLWLNEYNDKMVPPESGKVMETQVKLPGTLVTFRFSIGRMKKPSDGKVWR